MEVDDDYYDDDVSVESDASSDYEPENNAKVCARPFLCEMRLSWCVLASQESARGR
jgi:hypothetical protein